MTYGEGLGSEFVGLRGKLHSLNIRVRGLNPMRFERCFSHFDS